MLQPIMGIRILITEDRPNPDPNAFFLSTGNFLYTNKAKITLGFRKITCFTEEKEPTGAGKKSGCRQLCISEF